MIIIYVVVYFAIKTTSCDLVYVTHVVFSLATPTLVLFYRGFSWQPCWRAETMKQFCMKIDLISQGRENVLFNSALQHGGNDVT